MLKFALVKLKFALVKNIHTRGLKQFSLVQLKFALVKNIHTRDLNLKSQKEKKHESL